MKRDTWLWLALAAVVVALWWKQSQAEAAKAPPALVPSTPGAQARSLFPNLDPSFCTIPFVGGLLQCV